MPAWHPGARAPLGLDDEVHGNRRGPLPLRWVYLHMLRELAQHCGHADILRENGRLPLGFALLALETR